MNAVIIISALLILLILGVKKFLGAMRELFFDDEGSPVNLKPIRINKYKNLNN